MIDMGVADLGHRRAGAAPHAGRAHHAHALDADLLDRRDELFGARQHAGQGLADSYRHRRRPPFAVADDIEMGIERGDFINLGHRQPHFLGQAVQQPRRQAALGVLDQVQIFDQEVAAARPIAEQGAHRVQFAGLQKAALWIDRGLAAAGSWMNLPSRRLARNMVHDPKSIACIMPPRQCLACGF